MKKLTINLGICISLAVFGTPVYAQDPCETVLCMWGMLKGKGVVANCDPAVSDFKSIVVRKHGKFKPGATSDARRSFLGQCPFDKSQQDKIINKYGTKLW
ncbi:TrbM/KikA/MpfK family conjugal transfer protein [Pseudomonas juntendi]|uniref:TrbM/KikA/MpfK family conjugal transfer protein n=1 Tax=Pseudomonas juntendi TaxID=2666183 RepID=UPI003B936936